jgi:regulator of protease activity HflC (stomatin/prohibitin superfamily)
MINLRLLAVVVLAIVLAVVLILGFSQVSVAEEPIKLQSNFVGDKEQPAVSYFVPWEGPGGNEKLYRKEEDKYEKSIDAVDRDVMLRSMRIYNELNLEQD